MPAGERERVPLGKIDEGWVVSCVSDQRRPGRFAETDAKLHARHSLDDGSYRSSTVLIKCDWPRMKFRSAGLSILTVFSSMCALRKKIQGVEGVSRAALAWSTRRYETLDRFLYIPGRQGVPSSRAPFAPPVGNVSRDQMTRPILRLHGEGFHHCQGRHLNYSRRLVYG